VLVVHAAREGARAAAVDPTVVAARRAATAGSGLGAGRLQVELSRRGDQVEVVTRYRSPTDLPLVGALIPDLSLRANAAMRVEN
jgi:hypothetical protein